MLNMRSSRWWLFAIYDISRPRVFKLMLARWRSSKHPSVKISQSEADIQALNWKPAWVKTLIFLWIDCSNMLTLISNLSTCFSWMILDTAKMIFYKSVYFILIRTSWPINIWKTFVDYELWIRSRNQDSDRNLRLCNPTIRIGQQFTCCHLQCIPSKILKLIWTNF